MRWFSVGALPAVLLALYFTHSRGGILTLIVAAGTLIVLSRDRLWYLATLLIGGAADAARGRSRSTPTRQLANNYDFPRDRRAGPESGPILLAGIAVTLARLLGLRRLEAERLAGGRARRWRSPATAACWAGSRSSASSSLVDRRDRSTAAPPGTSSRAPTSAPAPGLAEASSRGRIQFWDVALEGFGEKPITGHGAGTYQFAWDQLRTADMTNTQAHSLYLQALDELGIVGGLLALGLVLFLLWTGFTAWRAAGRPRARALRGPPRRQPRLRGRRRLRLVLAAGGDRLGLLHGDRDPGRGPLRAALAGARRGPRPRRRRDRDDRESRRFGLTIAGLAVAWLTMLALTGPLLVDHEIQPRPRGRRERHLRKRGQPRRTPRARSSPGRRRPYLPARPARPSRRANTTEAIHRFEPGDRPRGPQLDALLPAGESRAPGGQNEAAQNDLDEAKHLNPLETCLTEGFEGCG